MKTLIFFLGFVGCIIPSLYSAPVVREADEMSKSLVRITNIVQKPDYRTPWTSAAASSPAAGTGFIIENQQIMTNAHMVSDSKFLLVEKDGDPKKYVAHVRHVAHDAELAIVQVEDASFFKDTKALTFGDIPVLGSKVVVYGYPLGWERYSVTEGVVSRVDFRLYAHSGNEQHLVIQIDAAINPGNSGGPVLQGGKVIGVAFQGFSGGRGVENVGFMIPTTVVKRFFRDVTDGKYDGYAFHGFSYMSTTSPALRRYLGLVQSDVGVVVNTIYPGQGAEGVLKEGDVILSIDGNLVDSDGNIHLDNRIVPMPELIERKLRGEEIVLKVWRDRKEEEKKLSLKEFVPAEMLAYAHDKRPEYVIFGGLVFQPMNRNLTESYPEFNGILQRYYFNHFLSHLLYTQKSQVVLLTQVLADEVNSALTDMLGVIVDKVNGAPIKNLKELTEVFQKPSEKYVIDALGGGRPIILKRAAVEAARERIRKAYGISEEFYLEEGNEVR